MTKRARSESFTAYFNPCGVAVRGIPAFGFSERRSISEPSASIVWSELVGAGSSTYGAICVNTGVMNLFLSPAGEIILLKDMRISPPRDVIKDDDRGNKLMIYDDVPFYWDAWDIMPYHLMTGRQVNRIDEPEDKDLFGYKIDESELPFVLRISFRYNNFHPGADKPASAAANSNAGRKLSYELSYEFRVFEPMIACTLTCDWHESHKLLKVEFPVNVRATKVNYDIQYGCVERPTHRNQSTDAAMFEVCGHKYADISEEGYGVAVINDSKYGYSAHDSTLCLSLLRSPKSPDPECDMGRHIIKYALLPHLNGSNGGLLEVVNAAIAFNSPLQEVEVKRNPTAGLNNSALLGNSLFTVTTSNLQHPCSLILDTIKLKEEFVDTLSKYSHHDVSAVNRGEIILRFYESIGSRGQATISANGELFQYATLCNMMEEACGERAQRAILHIADNLESFYVEYQPFQIITVCVKFAR